MRLACALLLLLSSASSARGNDACRVTQPPTPAFIPPAPYSSAPFEDGAYLVGTSDLWVAVWKQPWQGLRQKIFWWRPGFNGAAEHQPQLNVMLREVGSNVAVTVNTPATNASFDGESKMLIGVDFPAPGCWQVIGSYGGQTVSFITEIR